MNYNTVELRALRKSINSCLAQDGINYDYNPIICDAYDGEGFYINHKKKVLLENRVYAYDTHWAYGAVLISEVFPLSSNLTNKETELGIYIISFSYLNQRYKDFSYTMYRNKMAPSPDGRAMMVISSLDYPIFCDIYESDVKIEKRLFFRDIGKLPLEKIVRMAYKRKKEPDANKRVYEAAFYGKFAERLHKQIKKTYSIKKKAKLYNAVVSCGEEYINILRNPQVAIAMWQTAYLRYREWKEFKKYRKHVIYMNTDSIYLDENVEHEDSPELGHYGIEYFGKKVLFIRRNAYIVLNDDDSIYKSVIGGVINGGDITPEKLQILRNKGTITAKTYDYKRRLVEAEVRSLFFEEYYNI